MFGAWTLFVAFLIVWIFGLVFAGGWWPWLFFTLAIVLLLTGVGAATGRGHGRRRMYR